MDIASQYTCIIYEHLRFIRAFVRDFFKLLRVSFQKKILLYFKLFSSKFTQTGLNWIFSSPTCKKFKYLRYMKTITKASAIATHWLHNKFLFQCLIFLNSSSGLRPSTTLPVSAFLVYYHWKGSTRLYCDPFLNKLAFFEQSSVFYSSIRKEHLKTIL